MMERTQIQKEVKAYLKPVRRMMKFSKKTKETLYNTVAGCAIDLLNANPEATMEDIHRLWGAPDEWVNQFTSSNEVREAEKRYKRVNIAIVFTAAVLAVVSLVSLFGYMKSIQTSIFVENPTVIYKNM